MLFEHAILVCLLHSAILQIIFPNENDRATDKPIDKGFAFPLTSIRSPPSSVVCGIHSGTNRRLQDQFPWTSILGSPSDDGSFKMKCAGSLISKDTILTAANCFYRFQDISHVRVGEHDLSSTNDKNSPLDVQISQVIQHPDWNNKTFDNDLAIVKLSQDVNLSRNIG